jgi:hypothetical protein
MELDDLFEFNPAAGVWTELTGAAVRGSVPLPRSSHGFVGMGGLLYVHGGLTSGWLAARRALASATRSVFDLYLAVWMI